MEGKWTTESVRHTEYMRSIKYLIYDVLRECLIQRDVAIKHNFPGTKTKIQDEINEATENRKRKAETYDETLLVKDTRLIWIHKITILCKRSLYDIRLVRDQVAKALFNQSKSLSRKVIIIG